MEIASNMVWMGLLILIAIAAGGICLQIFLSSRENKWVGLILPVLTFLYSVVILLNLVDVGAGAAQLLLIALITLIRCNLSTVILLLIYFGCRQKWKRKSEMERMNIQDL